MGGIIKFIGEVVNLEGAIVKKIRGNRPAEEEEPPAQKDFFPVEEEIRSAQGKCLPQAGS
jgi:hypothetical protein